MTQLSLGKAGYIFGSRNMALTLWKLPFKLGGLKIICAMGIICC